MKDIYKILIFFCFFCVSCYNSTSSNKNSLPDVSGIAKYIHTYKIGQSVKGRPLWVTEVGKGHETGLIIIGGIHGNERNTEVLVSGLKGISIKSSLSLPPYVRLYFLSAMNPDGLELSTRRNFADVDLNRNFPTGDWKKDVISPSKIITGAGGAFPGSEPEVEAFTRWINKVVKNTTQKNHLISYHSAYPPKGSVQPGYHSYGIPGKKSEEFAKYITSIINYKYLRTWITDKPITGELIHWCELNGIISVDIELPYKNIPSSTQDPYLKPLLDIHFNMILKLIDSFLTG